MSTAIIFGRLVIFDKATVPINPPAGPENIVFIGASIESFAFKAPPPDRVI